LKVGIRETTRVEYKREFPSDLAKSISSLADAQGGIVVVGVDADDENKPILPFTGMALVDQPEERVYQICANSIYPPIFPNVWVARFDDPSQNPSQRAIIVIRVNQGETPRTRTTDGRKSTSAMAA
jgi:predicted HTH transcriptional regulator